MVEPTISVILPVYHAVDALAFESALSSVLNQTRGPDEVVIVEDGPLPEELEIAVEKATTSRPGIVRVKLATNRGQGAANQAGLLAASSEWIAKADADDISLPNRFELQIRAIASAGVDLCGTAMREFEGEPSNVVGVRTMPISHEAIKRRMRSNNPFNHPTVMYRRTLALAVGGYRELRHVEDYDLMARMVVAGARTINLADPLVMFDSTGVLARRRWSVEMLRAERILQSNLVSYDVISGPRGVANFIWRQAFRILPKHVLRLVYRRVLSRPPRREGEDPRMLNDRPEYDRASSATESRSSLAAEFARQIVTTAATKLDKPAAAWDVLDAGSGYGATALALSRQCSTVVACEPATALHETAVEAVGAGDYPNVQLLNSAIEDLEYNEAFDVIVLDNVYEHLPNQHEAMVSLVRALRPGGVIYLLMPNKAWPIEAHYRLPLLGWLPLKWADRYLKLTGRGQSYLDASFAPTYGALNAELDRHDLRYDYVLPVDPSATMAGAPLHYRAGMSLLRRYPGLWRISKSLLVVAKKPG